MSSSNVDGSNLTNPNEGHNCARCSSSTSPPHTLLSEPCNPEAPSSDNVVSKDHSSISSVVSVPPSPFPSFDPESSHRRTGGERSNPSGSQDDITDAEMNSRLSKPSASDTTPEGSSRIRQKRTRTLTTPHQAAVLQALLAECQFPTTQVREEVGRSIGLSARKVQIWFQNQRQKARRPPPTAPFTRRPLPTAPLTRRPRIMPFTSRFPGEGVIIPTAMAVHSRPIVENGFPRRAGHTGKMPYSGAGSSSRCAHELVAPAPRDAYSAEDYGQPGALPAQLAGPLMPDSSPRGLAEDVVWRGPSQGFPAPPSTSPTKRPELYRVTPPPDRHSSEQPERTPLSLPSIATRTYGLGSSMINVFSVVGPYPTLASPSALKSRASTHQGQFSEDTYYNLPPVNVDFSTPRLPLNIPPPFTLQPQPLWDDPAFSPYSRPGLSSQQHTAHRRHSGGPRWL